MPENKSLGLQFNDLNFGYFDDIDRARGAHYPVMLKFGCWDARMGGQMHTLQPGKIFFHRSAGATLPQNVLWDRNLQGYLALSALKEIRRFLIAPHSDCLAANTALNYPCVADLPEDHAEYFNLRIIHDGLTAVGCDLSVMAAECWDEASGDEAIATNLMAKRLAVISLDNLLAYKVFDNGQTTVGEAAAQGRINIGVIFVDLQNGHFEHFDPETKIFNTIDPLECLNIVAGRGSNDNDADSQVDDTSGLSQQTLIQLAL